VKTLPTVRLNRPPARTRSPGCPPTAVPASGAAGLPWRGPAAVVLAGSLLWSASTHCRAGDDAPVSSALNALVAGAALTLWGDGRPPPRVEVIAGQLDARLKLAPCQRIEPYLPTNSRPLGQTRVGLRCREGKTLWNVYLPVTVKLWVPGLVVRGALPAGTTLEPDHLMAAEVDLGASADAVLSERALLLGRTLARGVAAGEPVHAADLKARHWFAAGEPVRITAQGSGYSVQADGVAITAGIEGQAVRVRTEGGQIVTGAAVGTRQVAVGL
jgi:flagella basal body P-ring formation protein FlgA